MRAEGLIRKRATEVQAQADRCAGWHSGILESEADHLRWVLFDNECPECHHDCSEFTDSTNLNNIVQQWLCNNCGWMGPRNTLSNNGDVPK